MAWKAALRRARTCLFVPATHPELFFKALRSGADAIIIDLEDAVPTSLQCQARQHVREHWSALRAQPLPVVVRIQTPASIAGQNDLSLLAECGDVPAVMVPKVNTAADLAHLRAVLPSALILPLLETAMALVHMAEIAAAPGVGRLVLGSLDLSADLGVTLGPDDGVLDSVRLQMTALSRVHALAPPIDGVTVAIDDGSRIIRDVQQALRFGFAGKLCVHPRQVPVVHQALRPTEAQYGWATRVLEADRRSGGKPVLLDGVMIDAAVVRQARQIMSLAGEGKE